MNVAVIVTYNRKEELVKNLEMTLKQSLYIDKVVIIDNHSSDGTEEYLRNLGYFNNDRILYSQTSENIGGAGGFSLGTKYALNIGADWIILMDDDGYPVSKDTFKNLLDSALSVYNSVGGNKLIFMNSLVESGDRLSFKLGEAKEVTQALQLVDKDGLIIGEANPFNGTLLSKELIREIGYPNELFFIKGDEVDYKFRAREAGAFIATCCHSHYYHPLLEFQEQQIFGKLVPLSVETPWKEYYLARNFAYIYKKRNQFKAIAFELAFIKTIAVIKTKNQVLKTLFMVYKGIYHGMIGKLGGSIKP